MNTRKAIAPIVLVFVILNAVIFFAKSFFDNVGLDRDFLMIANLVLLVITLISFWFQQRGLNAPNPNVFVRSVYAALMLKIFICMIAVLIYAFLNKGKLNKPALFTSMGLYILYTAIEVTVLMKLARKKKNA